MFKRTGILLLFALVAACAPEPTKPPIPDGPHVSLTGAWWRLVEIRPAKGDAVRPADPLRYTLTFHADGSAEMQLDCNRGRGTYTAIPEGSPAKGQLRVGPLAVTKAFCPPPSLGDRVARDMDNVRSYRIEGNRLSMSLADGAGVHVWEQVTLD